MEELGHPRSDNWRTVVTRFAIKPLQSNPCGNALHLVPGKGKAHGNRVYHHIKLICWTGDNTDWSFLAEHERLLGEALWFALTSPEYEGRWGKLSDKSLNSEELLPQVSWFWWKFREHWLARMGGRQTPIGSLSTATLNTFDALSKRSYKGQKKEIPRDSLVVTNRRSWQIYHLYNPQTFCN